MIWEAHHIDAFMAVAPEPLQWALILAAETAQRQGDLLRFRGLLGMTPAPKAKHGSRLTPSKSITRKKPKGRPVKVPVSVYG